MSGEAGGRDEVALVVTDATGVDAQLAAALDGLGERELRLVVPAAAHALAGGRLAWLEVAARLLVDDGDGAAAREVPLPTRAEVLERYRGGVDGDGEVVVEVVAGPGEVVDLGARLGGREVLGPLGIAAARRGVSCARPAIGGVARAAIDLVGRDADGRVHVVVAATGPDADLAFRALDHHHWVTANLGGVAALVDADPAIEPRSDPVVDLVVVRTPGRPLLHRAARATLERLRREVEWRLWELEGDLDGELSVRRVWWNRVATGERWADRMSGRITAATRFAEVPLAQGRHVPETGGLAPGCDGAAADLAARDALHHGIGLPRSSQRFALNLFGALGAGGAAALLAEWFGPVAAADEPVLEWTDGPDRLGELTEARPHQTQVDVHLAGRTVDGRRVVALVEVKLTEAAFGECSHAEDAPPERRAACTSPGPFGGAPEVCWQLANRELGGRRRYVLALAPVGPVGSTAGPPDGPPAGCWFRALNQPMRSAALAAALVADGDADEVVVALCAPAGHTAMWRQWRQAKAVLAERLVDLDPAVVAAALPRSTQSFLTDRYGIIPTG